MKEEKTLTRSFLEGERGDKQLFGKDGELRLTAKVGHRREEMWNIRGRRKKYSSLDEALEQMPDKITIQPEIVYNSPNDWTVSLGDERYTAEDLITLRGALHLLTAHPTVEGCHHRMVDSYDARLQLENPYMYELCGKGRVGLLNLLESREQVVDLENFYNREIACMVGIGDKKTKSGKIPTFWALQAVEKIIKEKKDEEEVDDEELEDDEKKDEYKSKWDYDLDIKVKKIRIDLTEVEYTICQETSIAILGMQDADTIGTVFPIRFVAIPSIASAFRTNAKQLERLIRVNPLGITFMLESLFRRFEDEHSSMNMLCRSVSKKVSSIIAMEEEAYSQSSQLQEVVDALDFLRVRAGLPTNWIVTPESVSVTVQLRKECADYVIFLELKIADYPKRSVTVSAYAKFDCACIDILELNSEIDKKGKVSTLIDLLQSGLMDKIKQFQLDFEKMQYFTAVFNKDELVERFESVISTEKMENVFARLQKVYEFGRAYAATDLYIDVINQIHKSVTYKNQVATRALFSEWFKEILNPEKARRRDKEVQKKIVEPAPLDYSNGEIKLFV